jgi:hypothetical protein
MRQTSVRRLFRKNAIDTSIEAAVKLDVTGLELLVLQRIRKSRKKGITATELLSAFPHLPYSSVTARPAALKDKGLVVDTGLRRPGRFGRNQAVLVAIEFAEKVS